MKPAELTGLVIVLAFALLGVVLVYVGEIEHAAPPMEELFATPREAELYAALEVQFGTWKEPRIPTGLPAAEEGLPLGSRAWRSQCMQCHGATGGADTPTAAMHKPRPRDMRSGVVKYTSTEVGWPATRYDLMRTIRRGIPSTGMNSFAGLPDRDLEAVVDWTLYLLIRGQVWGEVRGDTGTQPAVEVVAAAVERARVHWGQAADHVVNPVPRPTPDAAAMLRGSELFHGAAGCVACHGKDGSGLPDGAAPLIDIWGQDVSPRDLRAGVFHGSDWTVDIYRRIHAGIKGTPMPGVGARLDGAELWSLVSYVESLQR